LDSLDIDELTELTYFFYTIFDFFRVSSN